MPITHEWNGTILTITSDSGTSSMDLQGSKGDDGCRGPQGPAGIIVDSVGNIDWNGYATETYVDEKVAGVNVEADLSNYYTKSETVNLVMNTNPNLTGYATEKYVDDAISDITGGQTISEQINSALTDYATKAYVQQLLGVIENGTY